MAGMSRSPSARPPKRPVRFGIWLLLTVSVLGFFAVIGFLMITGKAVRVPVWVLARTEAAAGRLLPPDIGLSLGGAFVMLGPDARPHLELEQVRLVHKTTGSTVLKLPKAKVDFDPVALLGAKLRPVSVVLSGASLRLRRDLEGRFDVQFEEGRAQNLGSFAQTLDEFDKLFAAPLLSQLVKVQAEEMSLTIEDARARRIWRVVDGNAAFENSSKELVMQLGLTLDASDHAPGRAFLRIVTEKDSSAARIFADIKNVTAKDIAAQTPLLGLLSVVEAPISGRLNARLSPNGQSDVLEGELHLGAGALRPNVESRPVDFEGVDLALNYDHPAQKIVLSGLNVQSRTLRLKAQGQIYVPVDARAKTDAFLTQIAFQEVMIDPEGLFSEPLSFQGGAMDLRIRLNPFQIDLGQFVLRDQNRRIMAKGLARSDQKGWHLSLDVALNAIRHDRLLALWPVRLVPKTRAWVVENVQEGLLRNVNVAVRLQPGQEPRLSLGYDFSEGDVRFIKTLPPIQKGSGYAHIEGNSYTMVVDKGYVEAPLGGQVEAGGTVFSVLDILQRPAQAEVRLKTRSSLTAALSLLDEPPFRFLTKAGKSPELGEGRAVLEGVLRFPLMKKIKVEDISYQITGQLSDVRSDVLLPGRVLSAQRLDLYADPEGLKIAGKGQVGNVPFDMSYDLSFDKALRGLAHVRGQVALSDETAREFKVDLPKGMLSGQGQGDFTLTMQKDMVPRLELRSNLRGIGLSVPQIGWSKPAANAGEFALKAELGKPPKVDMLVVRAQALDVMGRVVLNGKGLDRIIFSRAKLGEWLDAPVTLIAQGKGQPPDIEVQGGTLDLRHLPKLPPKKGGGGKAQGGTLRVMLDKVQVTSSLALHQLRGDFTDQSGLRGYFSAVLNGKAAITGRVLPSRHGTAAQVFSKDAGKVLAAAGIFTKAHGGDLDFRLEPMATKGHYHGWVDARKFWVQDAPVLANLLSAISVIGLLEQLNGKGIAFQNAGVEFYLSPQKVDIVKGAAVGASLGLSVKGSFYQQQARLDLRGVITPIYLLNGVGELLMERGEGIFGFNYAVQGNAKDPSVSVNILSILTPGIFREIWHLPAPAFMTEYE